MDVEVLNDARADLASRFERCGVSMISDGAIADSWLSELESLYSPSLVEASLEYLLATHTQCDPGVEDAVEFYVESLRESMGTTEE